METFERRIGVALPRDYAWFLAHVGTASADGPPHYGLVHPHGEPPDGEVRPGRPFPLIEPWVWEGEESFDEARHEAVCGQGWVWLGTDGCGLNWVVVVSGPARGQVWILADVGAAPYRAGRPFADWLGDWLAGGPV